MSQHAQQQCDDVFPDGSINLGPCALDHEPQGLQHGVPAEQCTLMSNLAPRTPAGTPPGHRGTSPDPWVLHDPDPIQQLCEEGVHLDVDGDELAQGLCGLQAHPPVRVLQGFGEGGLQLGQEGLQGDPHLRDKPTPQSRVEAKSSAQGTAGSSQQLPTCTSTRCGPSNRKAQREAPSLSVFLGRGGVRAGNAQDFKLPSPKQ